MSRDPLADLAQCDAEIAEAAAYTGPDEVGAAMGWADWCIEKGYVLEELKAPFPWFGGKSRVAQRASRDDLVQPALPEAGVVRMSLDAASDAAYVGGEALDGGPR